MNTATKTAVSPQQSAGPARARRPAWQWPVIALAAVLGVYLVGRGAAELFIIHWSDPASYAGDWGGPSLAGVLAVHSGPALAIIGVAAWRLFHWRRTAGRRSLA